MDLDTPETWRWIWLGAALVFAGGEFVAVVSRLFAPFAVGAAGAASMVVLGGSINASWAVFVVVSMIAFVALRRFGSRSDAVYDDRSGIGVNRWVGHQGLVLEEIAAGAIGLVRLDREDWQARALDDGPLTKNSSVVVAKVTGTRLLVVPITPDSTTVKTRGA